MAQTTINYRDGRGIIGGGIVAGIIAGIVMAMVAMMIAAGMGMGATAPLRLIAATLYGTNALIGGAGVLMVGLMIHMMTSAVFGVIFAALLPARSSGGAAFGWGVLYGAIIWAVMTFAIMPWANPVMSARVALMSGAFFIEHLAYGAALAITPGLVRSFSSRRPSADVIEYRERRVA